MGQLAQGMSRAETFAGYSTLETEVCATCGVLFAMPELMVTRRREDGRDFYCPNGHVLHYGAENEKLKRELEQERDRNASLSARLDQERAHSRALRGVVTKTKRRLSAVEQRAAGGVCPCCNRPFVQLSRHMKTKHPEYVAEHSPR